MASIRWKVRIEVRNVREEAVLERLPVRVPGARVQGHGRWRSIAIADHGVDLLHGVLTSEKFNFEWDDPGKAADRLSQDPFEVADRVLQRLVDSAILAPGVPFTDYQREGLGRAVLRGDFHLWFPPGAGKTRPAIAWALAAKDTDVLITTRVAALWTFAGETETITRGSVTPFVWLPPSRRRKGWVHVRDYVKLERERHRTPYIITGWENLTDSKDEILDALERDGKRPRFSWVADEIHRVRSKSRWDAEYDEDGEVSFALKDNQAAAAMVVSKAATRRLGLTGTPIPDRLRGLWAPLDLIGLWEWGKFYDWATRYCAGRPAQFGYMDVSGKSNLGELRTRLSYTSASVPMDVVRASLPGIAREMYRLTAADTVKPEAGWKSELKAALRQGGETALEAKIMLNAGKKRKWVTDLVVEALRAEQKVVVFTGRRRDAEALSASIERAAPVGSWVRWTHGEDDGETRFKLCEEYMAQSGRACLTATGDSIGESLNLQDTDLQVMPMLPWTPGQVLQWEGRCCRLGQKRRTRVVYPILENSEDERVAEILLDKLPVIEEVVGEVEAGRIAGVLKQHDDDDVILRRILEGLPDGEWQVGRKDD